MGEQPISTPRPEGEALVDGVRRTLAQMGEREPASLVGQDLQVEYFRRHRDKREQGTPMEEREARVRRSQGIMAREVEEATPWGLSWQTQTHSLPHT